MTNTKNKQTKPKQLRPWKAVDEVPVGGVLKKFEQDAVPRIRTIASAEVTELREIIITLDGGEMITPLRAFSYFVWKYPHQSGWKQCGVME